MKFGDGNHYASAGAADVTPVGGPRPVLVNMWYPAESAASAVAMHYSDYLPAAAQVDAGEKATGASAGFAQFVRELTVYDQDVVANEVFGAHFRELTVA